MAVVSNLIEICNAFAQHDCCGLHACIGTLQTITCLRLPIRDHHPDSKPRDAPETMVEEFSLSSCNWSLQQIAGARH